MDDEYIFWVGLKVPKEATSREIAALIYGPSRDVMTALDMFIADTRMYIQKGPIHDRKMVTRIETSQDHIDEMVDTIKKTPGYQVLWVVDNISDLAFLGQLPSRYSFLSLETSVLE
mgnify:CR=1 FL=1